MIKEFINDPFGVKVNHQKRGLDLSNVSLNQYIELAMEVEKPTIGKKDQDNLLYR